VEGFDVITSDEKRVGKVVGTRGDWLFVETGHLRRSTHALPKEFAHPDDGKRRVFVTLPKDLLNEAPEVDADGSFDEGAAAAHYGLASAFADPPAEGLGESLSHDPAFADARVAQAERERVEIRKRLTRRPPGTEEHAPSFAGHRPSLAGHGRAGQTPVDPGVE
jgi:hypothetical protein